MTNDKHNLIGFLAVLLTIVILTIVAAATGRPDAQIISGIMTGLVGVLGTFKPRTAGGTNVEKAETVNTAAPEGGKK